MACGTGREEVAGILKRQRLNTVCQSAQCPNLNECWHKCTATFMILGNNCTRSCKFCAVDHCANPLPPEADEAERVAAAAKEMNLRHVVVTSVTRDDLPDGGAGHFAAVIRAVRAALPKAGIEVLTPDFQGDFKALATVIEACPDVFNHNLETVERLSGTIRSKADYRRSLGVLTEAHRLGGEKTPVKSGIMVGLGERDEEVERCICEMRENGVSILTLGQYLPPTAKHWPLDRYVEPERFAAWGDFARRQGFSFVASAPLVRSSYNAGELLESGRKEGGKWTFK